MLSLACYFYTLYIEYSYLWVYIFLRRGGVIQKEFEIYKSQINCGIIKFLFDK